ncbi:MAG: ABC transporter permease [Treponema sp.]|nr:ABC transporter permease [Treponema sp.]
MTGQKSGTETSARAGTSRDGASRTRAHSLRNLATQWEMLLVYLLVAVFLVNSFISPYFLNAPNLLDSTFNFMEKAIMALPMMLVIICGDIDISVASNLALTSVFMGMASAAGAHTPVLILVGLVVGSALGWFNGMLITRFAIPSIAVTIGTLSLYRGIASVILGDGAYTVYPRSFAYFGQGYIPGTHVPFELVLFAVLAAGTGFLLHKTSFGRRVYAIGNNQTTTRFSGVNVDRYRLIAFTLNGLAAGIASILLTSRVGSTRPNIATGWELDVITTVVLGGVAITGGRGKIWGVALGVFLLGFLQFGMGLVNIPGQVMNIADGFILIIAIMAPELIRRGRAKASLSARRAAKAP